MLQMFIGLFIVFGLFEMITNTVYSLKVDGLVLAVKQHREVPPSATQKQMKVKVKIMLLVGILFFVTGIMAFINPFLATMPMFIVLALFSAYTLMEALYYKYALAFALAGLAGVLLVIYAQYFIL